MLQPVALKQRSRLAALLSKSMQQAALTTQPRPLDPRTRSTLGGLLLNLTLGQGPSSRTSPKGFGWAEPPPCAPWRTASPIA
jgi:hypothetical protein